MLLISKKAIYHTSIILKKYVLTFQGGYKMNSTTLIFLWKEVLIKTPFQKYYPMRTKQFMMKHPFPYLSWGRRLLGGLVGEDLVSWKKIFYSLWLFIIEKGCFRDKRTERASKYNTCHFDGKECQRKVWLDLSYSP